MNLRERREIREHPTKVQRLTFLGVSPLSSGDIDDLGDEEASTFDAESHPCFFKLSVKYNNLDFDKWARSIITDNAASTEESLYWMEFLLLDIIPTS